MSKKLDELLIQREQLLKIFNEVGDMRKGSISENYRRCGRSSCSCAEPGHPGHGPYYAFTRSVAGKTRTINRRPGPELNRLRKEVSEYKRFRQLCREVIEINEAICAARPAPDEKLDPGALGLKQKKGS
jgi:hypothetical protein